MADSSKPSWRRGRTGGGESPPRATPGGGAKPAAGDGGRGWQSRRTSVAKSSASGHRVKLFGLGLLVVALAAYFAYTAFFFPVKTPLLLASAAVYPAPFPPNSLAFEAAHRLAETNLENVRAVNAPGEKLNRQEFLKLLDTQWPRQAGGPQKNVVLLYLSAHAALNDGGEPCLILSDSSPLDAGTWLKFSEITSRVQTHANHKTVLLLDVGNCATAWNLGVLTEGFVERLEAELTRAAVPGFHVLVAASSGERSWRAPELGTTVFGHFLTRGLQSAASGTDSQITLGELAEYVRQQVSGWVRQNRDARQTPRLIPSLASGADFPIAYRSATEPAAPPKIDSARLASDWKGILEAWRLLDKRMRERQWLRNAPLMLATVQNKLLRMEELTLAGNVYRGDLEGLQAEVRSLLETDARAALPADLAGFSFPLQGRLATAAEQESRRQAIETVLGKWTAAGKKPVLKEGDPPLPTLDYEGTAEVAWRFVRQLAPLNRPAVRDALAAIDATPGRRDAQGNPLPEVGELLLLRMVDQYLDAPVMTPDYQPPVAAHLEQMLSARELAEQAASPADERAMLWVQPLVDRADLLRRAAEDAIFTDLVVAGDEAAQKKRLAAQFEFRNDYEKAAEREREVTDALFLRDEIWLFLPPLADWLLRCEERTRQQVSGGNGSLAAAAELIRRIADANHNLAATMDQLLSAHQTDAATFPAAVEAAQQAWTQLRRPFISHCQELRDRAGQDQTTLREISEVLRVPSPLLAVDERERLVTRFQAILTSGMGAGEVLARSGDTTPSAGSPAAEGASWAAVEQHPVLAILSRQRLPLLLQMRAQNVEPNRQDDSAAVRFARQGAQARKWLADWTQAARDLEDVTNRRLAEATETSANIRAGASEADRLARGCASLVSGETRDPAQRLRRVELHLTLLWHAHRALDDFWGPPPGSPAGTSPYFAQVTQRYLGAARRLEETPKRLMHGNQDLEQLLTDRTGALTATTVAPEDLNAVGDIAEIRQRVQIAWHAGLARPGQAAWYTERQDRDGGAQLIPVRDADGNTWRRQPLAIGESSTGLDQLVPVKQLASNQADVTLAARILYRGNLLSGPFAVRVPRTVASTIDPRMPRKAKIRVEGDGNRRVFIAFLLDCSSSMKEGNRLAKAIRGLTQTLEAIQGNRNYQVALFAYGHRAYFGPGNVPLDAKQQPVNVNPDRDVEMIAEIGPLTIEKCDQIKERLATLTPLGLTPLYYGIQTVARSGVFEFSRPEDARHIIVITDGIDYQFQERTTPQDVEQTLKEVNIDARVDVVMFAQQALLQDPVAAQIAAARDSTVEAELRNIREVAAQARGSLVSAEDPAELTKRLRDALNLLQYSVTATGVTPTDRRQDLGTDWVLDDVAPEGQAYTVRLHGIRESPGVQVRLEGGEGLRLLYDKAQDGLIFPPFATDESRDPVDGLLDPITKDQFRALPILPIKEGSRVEFRLALQNMDRLKFTPRPKHFWALIQPQNAARQPVGPAFHFYDGLFVPGEPVPILRLVIPNWPPTATQGSLRAWVKFDADAIQPNGVAAVEELKAVTIEEDIPNATFRAEIRQLAEGGQSWRVTVQEEHAKGTDLFTARVQAWPLPDAVQHQFYVGVDTAVHQFDYSSKPAPRIVVTAREKIEKNSLVIPLVVLPIRD